MVTEFYEKGRKSFVRRKEEKRKGKERRILVWR